MWHVLLVMCAVVGQTNARPTTRPVNPDLPTIFIIGDSTVKNERPGLVGWGDPIADFFDLKRINVVNAAVSGRSSRTFIQEGRWDIVKAKLRRRGLCAHPVWAQ